jgi:hypothetical protein
MGSDRTRRSDRVSLEVPIQVAGTDAIGRDFTADTRMLVLSRHGAKIVLGRKLVPDQEVSIFCKSTGKESVARVVGQMGKIPEGHLYGVELLDPEVNLWDIEFPPLSESEKAAARVLLECGHCHSRVLSYLNEFEAEVFEANGFLSRACKRCTDVSVLPGPSAERADSATRFRRGEPRTLTDPTGPDSKRAARPSYQPEDQCLPPGSARRRGNCRYRECLARRLLF